MYNCRTQHSTEQLW